MLDSKVILKKTGAKECLLTLWKRNKKRKKEKEEIRKFKPRVKRINGGYNGSSKEFNDIVLPFWSRYGIKPEKFWFDLYCAGLDSYDARFIPETVWVCDIRPYFNHMNLRQAYTDKGMLNRLFQGVKKPETIIKNMGGYFYNGDGETCISRQEAEEICLKENHLIFKPSMDSYGGSGIVFFEKDKDPQQKIPNTISKMKNNFVVQRIIKQHPDLERLNPSSLNTIRVLSFHFKNEVHILSAQLRIGGAGARVDNVASGGSACAIYPNGWLHEKSVTRKSTWTDETANGIKLKDIRVPNYEGVIETIKRIHLQVPYFNLIGWDFAVGEDGTPILVEYNVKPGQNQIGGKEPTFGDLTDEVLDEVFIRKTMV